MDRDRDQEEPEFASVIQEMAGDSELSEDDAQEILFAQFPTPSSQGSAGSVRDRDIAALKARTKCHWARESASETDNGQAFSSHGASRLCLKSVPVTWLQSVSRPNLSGAVSILQTSFGEPIVDSMFEADRIVREVKSCEVPLRSPSILMDTSRLVLTLLQTTPWTLAPFAPLVWKSHKQKRKTLSTLAAEAQATCEGIGVLRWCKAFREACVEESLDLKLWESAVSRRPSLVLIDCKSVDNSLSQCV
eukprot:1765105-Amphidinium_carterae.1